MKIKVTIVEFAVVVAIVSILAAIAFPLYVTVQQSGDVAEIKATMIGLGAAFPVMKSENGGYHVRTLTTDGRCLDQSQVETRFKAVPRLQKFQVEELPLECAVLLTPKP